MPSKKKAPGGLSKAPSKRAGRVVVPVAPPVLRVIAGADRQRSRGGGKGVKWVRNPWTPDDIVTLLKFVLTYQAGKYLLDLIKLWMEYRKAQKIEIKVGDNELKIEGHISDEALEKKIARFRELIKGATYEDIEVALPKGARRNIPAKLADRKSKRGGGDK